MICDFLILPQFVFQVFALVQNEKKKRMKSQEKKTQRKGKSFRKPKSKGRTSGSQHEMSWIEKYFLDQLSMPF